jgi:hypothetical protein
MAENPKPLTGEVKGLGSCFCEEVRAGQVDLLKVYPTCANIQIAKKF